MKQPFFEKLAQSQTILLAGAGGGYDIFCGLPLVHWLRAAGKTVHLANLSFTDILMRGDEEGLGTPEEDISSLLAASEVSVANKFLVCLGFGIDSFHGVCHAHWLENVSALIRAGGFLGSWSLQRDTPEYEFFREACLYVFGQMPERPSIVNGSIISAVEGEFGDIHSTVRTRGSELFINPLMSLYWSFDLNKVAEQNLYLDGIRDTRSRLQLSLAIEKFHHTWPRTRPPKSIPH